MEVQTKKKVLIVEDEAVNVEIYKSMLPDIYDLLIAENGEQALAIIQETAVDLLLLDVMLPDCSGFDICKVFKADSSRVHIPVIMVTALNSPDDKIKGLEAGANDFITKPADKAELLLKIKNQLTLLEQYNIIKAQKEEIDKYIRVMVHDLKNPLSVVGGYAELIENFTADERLKKYTSKIQSSAQDMLKKINDILAVRSR